MFRPIPPISPRRALLSATALLVAISAPAAHAQPSPSPTPAPTPTQTQTQAPPPVVTPPPAQAPAPAPTQTPNPTRSRIPPQTSSQTPTPSPDDGGGSGAGVAAGIAAGIIAGAILSDAARRSAAAASAPRVALVRARLRYDDGRLVRASVGQTRVVDTYAPKDVARDAGDWRVEIYGSARARSRRRSRGRSDGELLREYRILDPALGVKREALPGAPTTFERVVLDGEYPWRLVVPLYEGETAYDVSRVRVVDTRTGEQVLSLSLQ
ncbi:MAG: hypothetical protein ACFB00_07855 [Parvularculaceae bacterium]